jgi:two-component system, OmpR family, response regulator
VPTASPSERVLVVSADALRRKLLRYLLLDAGYAVAAVPAVPAALPLLDREGIDLLILDGSLPAAERLACCRRLRRGHATVAILGLTGRQDVEARITAFAAGVDDCLVCPFDPRELLARAGALLQRQRQGNATSATAVLAGGGLTLDAARLSLRLSNGRTASLAPLELRLLQCLLRNAGHVVTGDALRHRVWGQEESASNMLEVYIGRLRRKLAALDAPARIETVRGLGYRFRTDQTLPAADDRARGHAANAGQLSLAAG